MSTLLDWVAALGAPGGIVAGVVGKSWFDRGRNTSEVTKIDADAAKIIADTAVLLVAPLRDELKNVTERVQVAIDHIIELRAFIATHLPEKAPPPLPLELGL